ncbi:sensor histidine kinase [Sphingomonas sp. GlSt437]|uniref:sensor histidine kinase n=1 Tax=Sphingomonas sp. GlSt437 TaxID=3389970 RepID=UPI003A860558
MTQQKLAPRWINRTSIASLIAAIFVIDVFTDWAIAVAVLYIIPILLAFRMFPARGVRWLAAWCVLLTLLGSPLTRYGSPRAGIVNLAIGITAIVTTTYLGLRLLKLEAASHEARAHLQRLSRIGNLGELTASIAHEVNQPLAALVSSAGAGRRWLDADPPDVPKARETFERIARDAAHAAEVIAGVRRLASRRPPQPEPASIGDIVRHSIAIASAEIERHDIKCHVTIGDQLPMLSIDRVQVQQVLLNLLLNAIESLADGPRGDRNLWVFARHDHRRVVLAVEDNGPGLSNDAREHLWEPFWTSKQGGIGLGLAMSLAIAESHGGALRCSGRHHGNGALFELYLPTAAGGSNGTE